MKRRLLMFLGIVVAIVLVFGLYVRLLLESTAQGYLPGMIDGESYASGGFQDSTEYYKYTYKDTERLRKKLESHKNFIPVTADDIEYIKGYFNNFEGWVKHEDFYSEYDFDISCINAGDYFYIENKDSYEYADYDVYYFDMQSMTLYYIHSNI